MFLPDGSGKFTESAIPAEMAAEAATAREALIEMVAEADESLMEKFFEAGTLTQEQLVAGLRAATASGKAVSAALHVGGAQHRRPAAARRHRRLPAVARRAAVEDDQPKTGDEIERPFSENGPASAFVWKTIADPFAGRITMFRVMSGVLKADSTVHNKTRDIARAARPCRAAPGQDADERAGAEGGRPRRGAEAEGHADQRHARRQSRPGGLSRR